MKNKKCAKSKICIFSIGQQSFKIQCFKSVKSFLPWSRLIFFLFTQLNSLCIFHTIENKVWLFSAVKNSRISLIPLKSVFLGLDLKSKDWISAYPSRVDLNNSFLNLEASDRIPEVLLSSSFKYKLLLLSSWLKLSHSLYSLTGKYLKTNRRSPLNHSISL